VTLRLTVFEVSPPGSKMSLHATAWLQCEPLGNGKSLLCTAACTQYCPWTYIFLAARAAPGRICSTAACAAPGIAMATISKRNETMIR
jgi:hypothetical protein